MRPPTARQNITSPPPPKESTWPPRSTLTRPPQPLGDGPLGALLVAGISVGLLFVGWLLFYFLLFMPRGSVG